jgi:lysozyme
VDLQRLEAQLAIDEGKRLIAYLDTVGVLTVGIGHNCVARPVAGVLKAGDSIDDALCSELFADDIYIACHELDKNLPWWKKMNDVRQNVLANMAFNMGLPVLLQFRNTLRFMQHGSYALAAEGMKQSLWAKQVGDRAKRLAQMMETGEWL